MLAELETKSAFRSESELKTQLKKPLDYVYLANEIQSQSIDFHEKNELLTPPESPAASQKTPTKHIEEKEVDDGHLIYNGKKTEYIYMSKGSTNGRPVYRGPNGGLFCMTSGIKRVSVNLEDIIAVSCN